MSPRPRAGTRTMATLAAGALLATLVSGCSRPSVPTLSNGSVSACYRAIPMASTAVHDPKARLIGVHRISADQVAAHLSPADRAAIDHAGTGTTIDNDTSVCAVAWKGTFAPGQVTAEHGNNAGSYAVVLVTSRDLQVLVSFVLNQLPKRLRGRFV